MDFLVLTKTGGVLGPFATVLGYIMNIIYIGLEKIGIPNIGLVIILFTLITNLLMLPLSIKQQKSTKLQAIVNPEIQKITAKYKGKKDEASMRMQQAETQAVYKKYGTSMTGGCLYMLIQLPIMFALYRVIYNIPAYVSSVYSIYEKIAVPMSQVSGGSDIITQLMTDLKISVSGFDFTINKIIDVLYLVKTSGWDTVVTAFSGHADVAAAITSTIPEINNINTFIGGISIGDSPMANGWWPGILIPILAGVSQWLSVKVTTAAQPQTNNTEENPMGNSMKMMNTVMPLFSVFLCFSMQTGLGLYWIASAVFRTIISVIVNKIIDAKGIDKIIEENKAKAKKKAEKRGDKPSRFEEYAKQSTKNMEAAQAAQAKRKSISDLAGASVEGKDASGSDKKKEFKPKDYTPVDKDKASDGKGSISDIANMLKKKD